MWTTHVARFACHGACAARQAVGGVEKGVKKGGPVQVQVRVQFEVGIGATAAFMAPKYSPLGFRFDKLSIK